MRIFCLELLLFSLTLAAPTLQPQAEKKKQDYVEEQRITYKGRHEKHGYYMFKYVSTSSGRKNQTDMKEEKNKGIALPHSGKRSQEPAPKENIVLKKEEDLFLPRTNENNKSTKSQSLSGNKQSTNEDYIISSKENAHSDLKMSIYPESKGKHRAEDRDSAIRKLHSQEGYGAALIRNSMYHGMEPRTVTELLGGENKENKPRNVLGKIPADANYAKAPSQLKNHQRDSQAQNIPVKSKSTHLTQHNMDYLKQLPKVKKIPSDFEGSGYPDLQGRGDNDLSPFSGDGPPFKDISGKGDAIDPDRKGTDIQTELSIPSETETTSPDAKGPGYNEIPEKERNGRKTTGTRGKTAQEANTDVSLVEGSNDIIGGTDFKKLPGQEGNRVHGGSQDAHQGEIEFHYPHVPSKDQRKDGSRDGAEGTNYNEIPQNGKGSSRKGTQHSTRYQEPSKEKQRFPSKSEGQGQLIPPRGLDNEIKHEIGSHNGPNNEGTITTHSRKNHYVPHRQNNYAWNKGGSQSKGTWGYRNSHSNRRFRPPKKHDSSESSDSGSSSESDGD
ncbi:matrix extracellular phosphoglycoprotein isoform X2 [Bos indicus]|uniref:Matrix extracellular phosphoglycoprotein isoform X2 n=1 Tax=Bos indicus TaxID=9915 RepID=A0A6P5BWY3_BOSIN|nr:PREDICTED: matrix extracellular phosphoglycoprotein isoform X2 [Bos indicus]